jgi:hypothetical protein
MEVWVAAGDPLAAFEVGLQLCTFCRSLEVKLRLSRVARGHTNRI